MPDGEWSDETKVNVRRPSNQKYAMWVARFPPTKRMWKYKSIHETEVEHLNGVSYESKLKLSWVRLEMLHLTAGQ